MRRAWLISITLLFAPGCKYFGMGFSPGMDIGAACGKDDLQLKIEVGHPQANPDGCQAVLSTLVAYREEYEARFGHQDLSDRWVRLRNADDLREVDSLHVDFGVGGETYLDAIDLAKDCLECFPHEMNHVRRGSGHGGWCIDYNPWSIEVLGWDQSAYLGCGP
jgi:hypothetical protein